MEIFGNSEEYLLVSNIKSLDTEIINRKNETSLSIYWNKNKTTSIYVDSIEYLLQPNQLFFLTEFHHVDISKIESINLIKFNRSFYCIDNHDSQIGCKGLLFFGSNQMPIVTLDEKRSIQFEVLWNVFLSEMSYKDDFQIEMLQMLLKRFLILSTRIFREQNQIKDIKESKIDIIRDYNFLVEMHYKSKHLVSDYADLLNRPSKSLTNLFATHYEKSPLKIIQDRIFLEAKRYLLYSDRTIKQTAFELGFEDIQSFSRFFKNLSGVSPKKFKEINNSQH
jgi:AraC family transcriptional regulator, transcriptional activator of pobA